MKKPTKRIVSVWGGVFPPEIFGEIDAFLTNQKFVYLGVDSDGRLEWSRPCNEELDVHLTLIVEAKYVQGSEVAFATTLLLRSGKIGELVQDIRRLGLDPTDKPLGNSSAGKVYIAAIHMECYDAERFDNELRGLYRLATTYHLGKGQLAIARWMTQYRRSVDPLISRVSDPYTLINFLESSPSLPRARQGDISWASIAPQMYCAFIYFALGQIEKAITCAKQRSAEQLEHQQRELAVAQHYFEFMRSKSKTLPQ